MTNRQRELLQIAADNRYLAIPSDGHLEVGILEALGLLTYAAYCSSVKTYRYKITKAGREWLASNSD